MKGTVVGVSASPRHDFSKIPRDAVKLIEGLGVEEDAHMGPTVQHRYLVRTDPERPNYRQVHLVQMEELEQLQADGFGVAPGSIGENITTRGLPLRDLPRGTRLRFGNEAIVELTELREPCSQLDGYQQGLKAATLETTVDGRTIRKAGVMGIVLQGGAVRAGDPILVELPAEPHLPLEVG